MARSTWITLAALGLVVGCGSSVNTLFGTTSSGEGGQGAIGGAGGGDGGDGGTTSGTGGDGGNGGPCKIDCSLIGAPQCQISQCNEQIGQCQIVDEPDGLPCDDGLYCSVGDSCLSGTCIAGLDDPCGTDPPNACQQWACDEQTQTCPLVAKPNGTACTPADLCTVNSACQNGTCVGTPMDCSFHPVPDECHVSVCNPQSGQCEPQPGNNGQPCIDPNDLCAVNKTCAAGVCQGGQIKNCSYLDQGCQVGLCDPQNGQCTTDNAPNGTPCADAMACTSGETCNWSGSCTGGTPTTQCVSNDKCCPPGCTVNSDTDCVASQLVLGAVDRGWWRDDGEHVSTNDNTLTGYFNGSGHTHNSYFIFDLSGVAGTVVGAELWLEVEDYYSTDPSEQLSFWDVSTPAATLEASGSGQTQIFNDLMTGNPYGTATFVLADEATVKVVGLGAQAVTDINGALGGDFAIGGHAATVAGSYSQWVRFSMQTEPRIHYLVLTML